MQSPLINVKSVGVVRLCVAKRTPRLFRHKNPPAVQAVRIGPCLCQEAVGACQYRRQSFQLQDKNTNVSCGSTCIHIAARWCNVLIDHSDVAKYLLVFTRQFLVPIPQCSHPIKFDMVMTKDYSTFQQVQLHTEMGAVHRQQRINVLTTSITFKVR